MEFTVKVICSDRLKKRDVVKELNNGIHFICGSGDPGDWYIRELNKTRVKLILEKVSPIRKPDEA